MKDNEKVALLIKDLLDKSEYKYKDISPLYENNIKIDFGELNMIAVNRETLFCKIFFNKNVADSINDKLLVLNEKERYIYSLDSYKLWIESSTSLGNHTIEGIIFTIEKD